MGQGLETTEYTDYTEGNGNALYCLVPHFSVINFIAVGTAVTGGPPHRPVRADFPHTVLTSDVDAQSVHWDTDVGSSVSVASDQ